MKLALAQNLRRIGLTLEALCLLSILAVVQKKIELAPVLGIEPVHFMMAGLALGFVLWLVGTAAIYWPRKKDAPDS